jgi:hypothetical protein
MNPSLLGRTFARWIVKGLLVLVLLLALMGAGLAYATHNGHGPDVAHGGCEGCNHYTMVVSGSENRASSR